MSGNIVRIAPYAHIGQRIALYQGSQHAVVPVGDSKPLAARFGQSHKLAGRSRHAHGSIELHACTGHKFLRSGLASVVVCVGTENIDVFIAGIALGIIVEIGHPVGRIHPQHVVDALGIEHSPGAAPQLLILLRSAQILAPPEPRAGMLVPRAEKHRNAASVGIFER